MCPDGPVGPQGPGVATRFTFIHSPLLLMSTSTPNTDTDSDTDINTVASRPPKGHISSYAQLGLSNVILVRKHFSPKLI